MSTFLRNFFDNRPLRFEQERIKREEEERVTAQPGCGPGNSVALCLNILFTVDRRLTARYSSGCHPSLHSLLTGG